jgi:hypothetical protein
VPKGKNRSNEYIRANTETAYQPTPKPMRRARATAPQRIPADVTSVSDEWQVKCKVNDEKWEKIKTNDEGRERNQRLHQA